MNNALSLYIDKSEPSQEEFIQILDRLNEIAWKQFDEAEVEAIRSVQRGNSLVSLQTLEASLDWSVEKMTLMRNGRYDVPVQFMILLRLLFRRVRERPSLIRIAVMDHLDREGVDVERVKAAH